MVKAGKEVPHVEGPDLPWEFCSNMYHPRQNCLPPLFLLLMGGEGAPPIFCNGLLRQASIIQDMSSLSESPGEGHRPLQASSSFALSCKTPWRSLQAPGWPDHGCPWRGEHRELWLLNWELLLCSVFSGFLDLLHLWKYQRPHLGWRYHSPWAAAWHRRGFWSNLRPRLLLPDQVRGLQIHSLVLEIFTWDSKMKMWPRLREADFQPELDFISRV